MAEISTIRKSDVVKAGRFDAEYFQPEYLKIEKKLEKVKFNRVEEIFEPIKNGFDFRNYEEKGDVFYIRTADIKETGFQDTAIKIRFKEIPEKVKLKENDILFTRKGNYGKNCLVDKKIKHSLISSEIMILRKKCSFFNHYYLSTFLNSIYGQNQIERNVHGVSNFSITQEALKKIKIPILSESFQLKIEKIVKTAHENQSRSKKLYQEAEHILLKELGLTNYTPKHELTFEIRKKEVDEAKRFDAEYFQPKYKKIIGKIENYAGSFDVARNVLKFNKKNFFAKENEHYYYVPLSKVLNNGEIEIPKKEIGKNLPTRARRLVKKGQVIVSSISGSLETSAVIEKEHNNFVVSNGFYVFNSTQINSETLLILFRSQVMLQLLKRISKGSILESYDLKTFEALKIPLIKSSVQKEIAEKIKESHKLRRESKSLLEKAKEKVEQEIEKQ